jgi:tRNA(fMet)-specific endonuclease VapC
MVMLWRPSVHNAMPGKRYLFDTNALVALLQGNLELVALTQSAQWLGLSVINVLEFAGFEGLSDHDRNLLAQFVSRVTVVDLAHSNVALMAHIAAIRQTKALKLPDAIVMASAALHQATVVTNDAQLHKLAAIEQHYAVLGFTASA